MDTIFAQTAHRPWPLPQGRWAVAMRWHDLLFAHWPVKPAVLRPLIPAVLELDTHDGWAWIGIVPFRMTGVRAHWMPAACSLAFPELNVRTYVKLRDKRGVWFFSLDAASRLAVRVARAWYRLPYYTSRIDFQVDGQQVRYGSQRVGRGTTPAELQADYMPTGGVFQAIPGSLEHWLIERYCLFSADCRGRIGCAEIHHPPWPLQAAETDFQRNTMLEPLGIRVPAQQPLLHFARELSVVAWSLRWHGTG